MSQEQLAQYSLIEKIGQGGMGEVFRARDTNLGRDVALKFLPDTLAHDSDRLSRFEREARLLASLNHPNIASIHDFVEASGKRFLVLEMIEGEDLAERLARGPMSVDEALNVARQIVDALETAHEEGVIHRDLKPANIKVSTEGNVKVLDFGLAKAWESDATSSDVMTSPTVMASSPTVAGVILGTAPYMSPEQARGGRVDKRTDIFAFGSVLYEMLTGRMCFTGETVSDTLAAVLRAGPDWDRLPEATPRPIKRLLRRCLEKKPKQRLRDIGEARIVIDAVLSGEAADETPETPAAAVATPRRRARSLVSWGLILVFAVTTAVAGLAYFRIARREVPVVRTSILPPENVRFNLRGIHPGPVVISPDGKRIVYTGREAGGSSLLYVRELDATEATVLAGTEDAGYPFWSPDGLSVGFFANGKLKRVDVSGSPPLTLAEAPVGKGGTWNRRGTIVFAPSFNSPLHRIPDVGGESEPVTAIGTERGENSHRFPVFLPDGDRLLYFARGSGEASTVRIGSLSGDVDRELLRANSNVDYAAGFVLFLRQTTLMAHRFDPEKLEFAGDPVPVADPVRYIPGAMRGIFSASENGMLVYQAGLSVPGGQLVWRDPEGNELGRLGDIVQQDTHDISPDGRRVVSEVFENTGGTGDLWIYDVARSVRSRFTFDPGNDMDPVWSPDGRQIVFASSRTGRAQLHIKNATGASNEELLVETENDSYPADWSSDGRYITFFMNDSTNTGDIWALPMFGERSPRPVVATRYGEYGAVLSDDGHWMAYISDESGQFEVYVTSFPEPDSKWQVSSGGGFEPRWDPKGKGVYYFGANNAFHFVEAERTDSTFAIGGTRMLFESNTAITYRIAPDGERFLVLEDADKGGISPLTLVTNWTRDLEYRRRR